MSAYVCSEHITEPVTWRGTGCSICEIPREARTRHEVTASAARWDGLLTPPDQSTTNDQEVTP